MKAMKGLLLGTAAGLFAVAGAQAADLPVKAKPVEYVKVCSLYGAGFFYVPGTDTCLKFGMYLRADHGYNVGPGNYLAGTNTRQAFTRTATEEYGYRARMALSTDWRTQSDYGVIRAYALLIFQQGSTDAPYSGSPPQQGVAGLHRAFLQFAGFTVGHAVSYFDFINGAAYGYAPSTHNASTGVVGTDLIAYTAQLGNGWSASIDIEDGRLGRSTAVYNATSAAFAATGIANSNQALSAPDVAGNIRVDQAWGSAQIMAAAHNISAGYYGATTLTGHPSDAYGWAIGGGFKINNFLFPTDTLEMQAEWGSGATAYTAGNQQILFYGSGNSLGFALGSDGVFAGTTAATGTSIERTDSWDINLGYEHHWNPQWRTALWTGYNEVSYSNTAKSYMCGAGAGFMFSTGAGGGVLTNITNCDPSFSTFALSTRTAWNPHPTLEIGLDLIWAHLNTSMSGTAVTPTAFGARPAGTYTIEDQDYYGFIFRVQKTLLP